MYNSYISENVVDDYLHININWHKEAERNIRKIRLQIFFWLIVAN